MIVIRQLVLEWSEQYLKTGNLPMFNQGKFVKTSTIISDEQIQNQFKNFSLEI